MDNAVTTVRPADTRLPLRYWRSAAVAGMASYLDSGLIVTGGLALSTWQKTFSIDSWTLGLISAMLTFSIAVGALFGGRIADVLGRRRVFTVDVLIYVVGIGVILLAQSPAWLIVGVAIAGLAAGADLPTSVAVVAGSAPDWARGRLVAFTQVMWSVGIGVTTALGFIFSSMGRFGITMLFLHLGVVGLVTWVIRIAGRDGEDAPSAPAARRTAAPEKATPLRAILTSRQFLVSILLTGLFYIAWNLMANTLGQFKAFFLTTVSGVDQTAATAAIFVTTLMSIAGGIVFTRVADTRARRPMFYIGAAMQIVGMLIGAVTGGGIFVAMLALMVLYNLFYPFAGEAIYKVWTQESFPANARASVQGFTYSVSRFAAAGFALVTPAIVEANPPALLWVLVACAVAAAVFGSLLIRRRPYQGPAEG